MPKVTDKYLTDKRNFILECTGEILKEKPLYAITMRDIMKEVAVKILKGLGGFKPDDEQ